MFNFGRGVTVVLVHVVSGAADRWNNVTQDTSERETLTGVVWVPMQTSESAQGSEEVIGNGQFYLPTPVGAPVKYLDEILYNGKTYQVQGDPEQWTSPWTGLTSPVRVNVREVTGAAAHTASAGSGG